MAEFPTPESGLGAGIIELTQEGSQLIATYKPPLEVDLLFEAMVDGFKLESVQYAEGSESSQVISLAYTPSVNVNMQIEEIRPDFVARHLTRQKNLGRRILRPAAWGEFETKQSVE